MKKRIGILLFSIFFVATLGYAAPSVRILPLTISIQSSTTTVGTSATAIPTTALVGRESIALVLNDSTDTVFIGGSDVTAANGFRLDSTVPSISIDIDDSVVIYGIVSSGTAEIRSIEAK